MTSTDLLTPREAARRIGVAASTVYRWIDRGKLPAVDATPTPDGSQGHDRYGRFTPGGLRVPADVVERLREERGSLPAWTALAVGPLLAMFAVAAWAVVGGRWYEVTLVGALGLVWYLLVRGFAGLDEAGECWSCGELGRGPMGLCRDCRTRLRPGTGTQRTPRVGRAMDGKPQGHSMEEATMTVRDRLAEAIKDALWSSPHVGEPGQLPKHRAAYLASLATQLAAAALSVLTEQVEIVTPHREGCTGKSVLVRVNQGLGSVYFARVRCSKCPFEARFPERLLVELVEAKEGR